MTNDENELIRSWLYVPGQRERMILKSFELDADAVIYDLEDAVPLGEKSNARKLLTRLLMARAATTYPKRYIRVNHPDRLDLFNADLSCALSLQIEGIALPKIENVSQIEFVDRTLNEAERTLGLPEGTTKLMLLIESPLGLINAYPIASSSPRIIAMAFGAEDFSREMGLPLVKTEEAKTQLYARSAVAIAAAAAGVQSIDIIWTDLHDADGFAAEARQARRIGFTGKAAIHPDQIQPIHEAFSPTDGELAYAREVLTAYEAAVSSGTGAINHNGAFLEEPVVARARQTLKSRRDAQYSRK